MASSAIAALRDIILEVVRYTAQGEWKVFITDHSSNKIVDAVVKADDILQENVTNVEQIESKRSGNNGLNAVYLLSPEPHIVDCLVSDIEKRKYRRMFLVWTSPLPTRLRERIDRCPASQELIALFRILNINFLPRESHLITFQEPWSFPTLFHPACNSLVKDHMDELAQKIVSICVTLGEYPIIRYYRPPNPLHEAAVLCSHLARFVQEGLDEYASYHRDFPPPSPRPRGILIITDRTIDLFAPLIHEFTYQAMVHELLPLREEDKTYYKTVINQGSSNQEEREMELGENDKLWIENRHLHMKDLLEKLVGDFNKFRAENPQFAESSNATTLSNIKDMLAGLPQFQQGKELYSLHLSMAQECMNIFQACKLPDVASVEQSMATGLDEDYRRPKNLTDQLVRLLDEDAVAMPDRLRLIIQYILYRDGIFTSDIEKLLAHSQLPQHEAEIIQNLELLGARVVKQIKDQKPEQQPLFTKKQPPSAPMEDLSLSRFDPAVKYMLEELMKGTLDQRLFPYTKPEMDGNDNGQMAAAQSSLRHASTKPTWARTRPSAHEPKQRIILFIAGGGTYSESRACYELSRTCQKDIYMATSHMVTPNFFLRQTSELSVDRRKLNLPADAAPLRAPAHIFDKEASAIQPLTTGLAAMTMNSSGRPSSSNGTSRPPVSKTSLAPTPPPPPPSSSKLVKEHKEKKRGFFNKFKD